MSLTLFDRKLHLVKETPTARLFRRLLNFQDIITFWSLETGQWILGYWLDPGHRAIEEIEDLGVNFEQVTPTFTKMITDCWRRVDFAKHKKRLLGQHKDKLRRRDESIIEDNNRWQWMRKQTRDKTSVPFAFTLPSAQKG